MTRPANGDVATPSLMKPIRSDLPRARLRANALEWYPRRSATLRTLRRVFSGIRTFLLSLIAHDAVAVETPAALATSCSVTLPMCYCLCGDVVSDVSDGADASDVPDRATHAANTRSRIGTCSMSTDP